MTISIDWANKIITIPRNDLPIVQVSPEIRELDLNWFRLQLKDLEDSEAGMSYQDTHRHNTEVSLSGLLYARVIEIINGYTVTFEDGQYAVNAVGANSNLMDVKNANQVSLCTNNSAGLTRPIATGVFAQQIESGIDFLGSQRLILAALAGVLSGAEPGPTTITIKNAKSGAPGSKVRITAEVDQFGNRTGLVFDLTD